VLFPKGWGQVLFCNIRTGIPKIMRAMQCNDSPPAEFEFDEDHSYFLVRLPIHPAALAAADAELGLESAAVNVQTTQETTQKKFLD
jgi:ATP-dependent DNA helicase RecG